jgi:PadR family transcriptional regulator
VSGEVRVRKTNFCETIDSHIGVFIMQCHEPIFGLGMIEELGRHGYRLSPGTLYPIMHGLEKKRLLRSKKRRVNGKIRRVYTATRTGRKTLQATKRRVRELFGELFEN